mmetsp:Transcript_15853/g.23306  ORF Transcript_15853/g.23306 Transcript_15853/m.23306 type:complete len:245 (+) Transcript_15853:272-1006(+)
MVLGTVHGGRMHVAPCGLHPAAAPGQGSWGPGGAEAGSCCSGASRGGTGAGGAHPDSAEAGSASGQKPPVCSSSSSSSSTRKATSALGEKQRGGCRHGGAALQEVQVEPEVWCAGGGTGGGLGAGPAGAPAPALPAAPVHRLPPARAAHLRHAHAHRGLLASIWPGDPSCGGRCFGAVLVLAPASFPCTARRSYKWRGAQCSSKVELGTGMFDWCRLCHGAPCFFGSTAVSCIWARACLCCCLS